MSKQGAGRVVIVIGAGQGLGHDHALAFGREGARVVVTDVSPAAADVSAEIVAAGGTAPASIGDVSDWDYAGELVRTAVGAYCGLDALVSNAGRVFEIEGGRLSVADGRQHGEPAVKQGRWKTGELGPPIRAVLAAAPAPAPVYGA